MPRTRIPRAAVLCPPAHCRTRPPVLPSRPVRIASIRACSLVILCPRPRPRIAQASIPEGCRVLVSRLSLRRCVTVPLVCRAYARATRLPSAKFCVALNP